MERWMLMQKKADFFGIAERFGIDPVIARVIRNRGIIGDEAIDEYLNGGIDRLLDPFLLRDMDLAVRILKDKIASGAKIRVMGDYDIDGVMSSYILKRGLTELGAHADARIPHRMEDGYGLSVRMIEEAAEDGIDTIVTCDNGISQFEAVSLAKAKGMTMIVTDHHEVLELPDADAVIDPKRPDDESPNKNLCGGAVAWKLILALGGDPELKMLQYAAFATVGDIVELTGENRILVKEGLKKLRNTDNLGLRTLSEVCGREISAADTYTIGFILGPCLNAGGRLNTAMKALALLESDEKEEAEAFARELRDLNESRKAMTEQGTARAVSLIEGEGMSRDKVLVVFLPEVHESVAGIIAGRLRERYSRPVFVLTRGESSVKGSGRSIEAYSMFDELVKVKELMLKFGGHPMAAGLSLDEEKIPEFRRKLNELCSLADEDLVEKVQIDVAMPISYVTWELAAQLKLLEPFGPGNRKPVFAEKNVYFDQCRILGTKRKVLKARLHEVMTEGSVGPGYEGIAFRNIEELSERIRQKPVLGIIYELSVNEFRGNRTLEFAITHFK